MATVKVKVPAFEIEIDAAAENEGEFFDNYVATEQIADRAIDKAVIVSAEWDEPEPDEDEDEEEEEESEDEPEEDE